MLYPFFSPPYHCPLSSSLSSFIILRFFSFSRGVLSAEMKLICCTTPLPPACLPPSSSSSSLLSLLLPHLNLILSLLCGEDWTRHFNLFILDMNLLACLALSLTLPTSKLTLTHSQGSLCTQTHTQRFHTYLRTCMHTLWQNLHSNTLHSTQVSKQIFQQIPSLVRTHTHDCWHPRQTFLRRVSPSASIKAIDMNLSYFLHAGSSSNIAAVLFSSDTSFIRACVWKIAAYSRSPTPFSSRHFYVETGDIAGF